MASKGHPPENGMPPFRHNSQVWKLVTAAKLGERAELVPFQRCTTPSLPACPGHQTHKGRGRASGGLARCHVNAAPGALASPCAARHLRNECHYWGPAGQAPARPSHPGCEQSWGWGSGNTGLRGWWGCLSPPWPQSSALDFWSRRDRLSSPTQTPKPQVPLLVRLRWRQSRGHTH